MPGSISPASGLVQNANSTWLNGKAFGRDLEDALAPPRAPRQRRQLLRPVGGRRRSGGGLAFRVRGDPGHRLRRWTGFRRPADRRAARDRRRVGPQPAAVGHGGGASGAPVLVRAKRVHGDVGLGPRAGGRPCSCRRRDAHQRGDRGARRARRGSKRGRRSSRHASRLARGLAHVVNIFDPSVIVLGGGLSKLAHLYAELPAAWRPMCSRNARRSGSSRPGGAMPAACAVRPGCGDEGVRRLAS